MNQKAFLSAAFAAALAPLPLAQVPPPPQPVPIDVGRVLPIPPTVRATLLQVGARIVDGVATVDLKQTLRNDGGGQAEATWILPLPPDAVADAFTMTVGGKAVAGEVLDATQARQIYEDIVRRMRDPGLLEYVGQGCLKARVFPIPAQGSVEVHVRYRHVVDETSGLHHWSFPLRAAGIGCTAPEKLSLDLRIRTQKPLKNVWSPLSGCEVVRVSDHEARASFEIHGRMPERDLEVFYGTSEAAIGLDLLSFRKAGEPGHLMLMVSPKHDWPEPRNQRRIVQFVLDTSGSMQGEKIVQARNALRFFVESLRPADLFNVVPFSTEARPFFPAPVPATPENLATARERIAAVEARGGTNIDEALAVALAARADTTAAAGTQDVPIVVFLTDGLPTVGETDAETLLKTVAERNTASARVFVFGVGSDVHTKLLDGIAEKTRGDRDYVREGEDIEVKTSALFTKLSHPVLTDVTLHFDGLEVFDVEPKQLPDLFKGSRLVVLARYRGEGHHAVRLRGTLDGAVREFVYETDFPAAAHEHDFVPVLWAQRRVATLLDAIRINGAAPELVEEVRRLGREYGIVTPYTSHLIVEEGMQIARFRGVEPMDSNAFYLDRYDGAGVTRDLERAGALPSGATKAEVLARVQGAAEDSRAGRGRLDGLPEAEASGADAVDTSLMLKSLRTMTGASRSATPDSGVALLSRRAAGRNFHLVAGVWVDSLYQEAMRGKERKVVAYSDEYFELLREHPELREPFALSDRLVVVLGGTAIEITPPAE